MAELISATNKNLRASDKSKYQEMRDIFEIMKRERRMCLNNKMVIRAITKCLSEDTHLNQVLKNKVENLLLAVEVDACMTVNTKHSEEKLLGLSDISTEDLSFNELGILQHSIDKELKLLGGGTTCNSTHLQIPDDSDLFELNIQDKVSNVYVFYIKRKFLFCNFQSLFEAEKKLQEIQLTYMENLKNVYDLLQELLHLRFNPVKDLIENKIDEYSMKSKMYSLKSDIFKQKARTDIFNQNAISFGAYEKLFNDIFEQQNECQKQIDDLIELKEKYNIVSCKEYDEILKSYLQYKSALEKKKDLYKQLTCK